MGKIQKWWVVDQEARQEHRDGNVMNRKDVEEAYHPLLRDLRMFLNGLPSGHSASLTKRINELLDEEEFPKARATVKDIQKVLGKPDKPDKPGEAKGLEQSGVTYRDF